MQGKVIVSPSALVRFEVVEMMVAMGEVAGVEEAKVRRARERPIGPVRSIFPILQDLPTSIEQLNSYHMPLVLN